MSMISLTFPDGASRDYPAGVTAAEVAASIAPSLARNAVSASYDGSHVDLAWPLERSGNIAINTMKDEAPALELIRRKLGVEPSLTVAVGDQRNDLEMLRWAARGVAMGNAPDEVKAVADEVCGHVDDDGLADVLRSLL